MKKTSQPLDGLFDVLVFVGRFQPFHAGHRTVIEAALRRSRHVLVLVGSANAARSPRNPFSYDERMRMIVDSIPELDIDSASIRGNARIIVRPVADHLYNEAAWIGAVQAQVDDVVANAIPSTGAAPRIGIIGHSKDHSSYYLSIFPTYEAIDVPGFSLDGERLLSATDLRALLFTAPDELLSGRRYADAIPAGALALIAQSLRTAPLAAVRDEFAFSAAYRAKWATAPFPPTFMTVDAVVQQAGHVLMVVRNEQPGRGRLALPGGFLKQDETLFEGALRELHEETQIDVPRRVLIGARRADRTFDDPFRSSRGRTITHAFRFDLSEKKLPRVKGGDDAAEARWVPLSQLRPEACFEDHAHIIHNMLGVG
jgi:bifunctional NMN adenylyltransferase/nudix hydrolase